MELWRNRYAQLGLMGAVAAVALTGPSFRKPYGAVAGMSYERRLESALTALERSPSGRTLLEKARTQFNLNDLFVW